MIHTGILGLFGQIFFLPFRISGKGLAKNKSSPYKHKHTVKFLQSTLKSTCKLQHEYIQFWIPLFMGQFKLLDTFLLSLPRPDFLTWQNLNLKPRMWQRVSGSHMQDLMSDRKNSSWSDRLSYTSKIMSKTRLGSKLKHPAGKRKRRTKQAEHKWKKKNSESLNCIYIALSGQSQEGF